MGKRLRDGKKAENEKVSRKHAKEPSEEYVESEEEDEEVYVIDEGIHMPLPEMLRAKVNEETGDKRIVLEALHTLHTQIEDIQDQQALYIQQVKLKYFKQMKPILKQSSEVILGKATNNELLKDKSLTPEQRTKGLAGLKLEEYWPKVFEGSDLTDVATTDDRRIFESVLDFSMDLDRNGKGSTISLEFTFKECPIIEAKSWKCTMEKTYDGTVTFTPATPLKIAKKSDSKLFKVLNGEESESDEIFEVFADFFEEVYPLSLYYYYNLAVKEEDYEDIPFGSEEDESRELYIDSEESASNEKPRKQQKKSANNKPATKTEKPECNTQ